MAVQWPASSADGPRTHELTPAKNTTAIVTCKRCNGEGTVRDATRPVGCLRDYCEQHARIVACDGCEGAGVHRV